MHARLLLFAAVAMCCGLGCTHTALERRTVKQASTLTDLQYQQVLDNMAMLACNPDTMPWHLKLKGGLVQIADQGSGAFGADIATAAGGEVTRLLPSTAAQRGIVGQWDVDPAVEADELALLAIAYRKATCPGDPELPTKIDKAICDLCVRYDIIPDEDVLRRIFASNNVTGKIEEATKAICEQLGTADKAKMKEQLDKALAGCGTNRVDAQVLNDYPDSLKKELTLRLLDLLQTKSAVEKLLVPEAVQTPGRPTYGAARLLTTPAARPGVAGYRPERFTDENKDKLPKPLSPAEQILFALHLACDPGYIPPAWTHEPNGRNVGLVAQAGDKIEKLQDLIKDPKFQQPWLNIGCKKDVPKCACYVGRYHGCHGDCYVWVTPEHSQTLRDFTQIILTLAASEKQDLSLTVPGRGAAFSPSLGR